MDNKYRIEKVLGQGGMARVYLATQEPLGRQVAVKVLTHVSPDPNVRDIDEKRFFREASLASKLTHPNTVIIHDYGTLGGDKGLFLVMEYLDGTSLAGLLGRVGYLRWDAAYPILKQIAGSLEEAHGKGLIHRDLKPLNIMVSQKVGAPVFAKVLDFGLAKPMKESADEQVTVKGTIVGSPIYMSPEQIFDEDVDHRSDIYSLGVLAFEMLTGRPPFILEKEGHVRELLKQHLTGSVPKMRDINPNVDVPAEVELTIRRCLAKKSRDRFASVQALLESLRGIKQNETSGSGYETADFTHHHLRPSPAAPHVDTIAENSVALSTTRVGAEDNVAQPEASPATWTTQRTLLVLAAVLALVLGLTVFLSSDKDNPSQGVALDQPSPTESTSNQQASAPTPTEPPSEPAPSVDTAPSPTPIVAKKTVVKSQPAIVEQAVRVMFTSEPAGAQVFRDDARITDKVTPFVEELKQGEVAGSYTFTKRGFLPAKEVVPASFDGDEVSLRAKLQRIRKVRKRNPSSNPLRRRER